jgi:hypothetical protein
MDERQEFMRSVAKRIYQVWRRLGIAGAAAMLLGLQGCASIGSFASAMYATRYGCIRENQRIQNIKGYRVILVQGCGFQQLYACGDDGQCISDGERTPLAAAESLAPVVK